ncbi:hypothetical protein PSHT_08963 [Puccinia striiformis]|uniref:Uncharacterized protein n=1 Tax=Puccinia striiformis TaxID=27350 RepID=A0A2S4VKH1_9BASI|nr:hypothetical protein PSHT_08963 [Puccinia striiformis]
MSGQSDPHTTASTSAATTARRTMGSEIYNLIPPKAPPNLMNSELYAGRSAKPVPMEFSLPSTMAKRFPILGSVGVWGVLFADFGNGDREIVFSPIRRWFAPYKSLIFGSDHLPSPSPEIVTNPDSNFPSTIEPNTN